MRQLIAVFICVFCCQFKLWAAASVTVATDAWEGYSDKSGGGYYLDLIRTVFEDAGVKVNIKIVPYPRSMEMVSNNKADVMLGAYPGAAIKGTYSAMPLNVEKIDAAITPTLNAVWQGPESLEGKKVGAVKGLNFDQYLSVKMDYKEVSNLPSLMKMLDKGRMDAVLAAEADLLEADKSVGGANHVIKHAVIKNKAYAVFANSENGQAMLAIFNKGMEKIHGDGTLKALMQKNLNTTAFYPD